MKSSPASATPSVLERKLESTREGVFEHAIGLFLSKGYQQTTIDDIARAAGIGRRTFFRYFKTKDDVVLWKFDRFAQSVVERLADQPANEAPIVALSRSLIAASEFYNREPAQTLAVLRLTLVNTSLYAQQLLQEERWKGWFAEALRRRMRVAPTSVLPDLVAAVGLEVFAMAVRRWVMHPDEDLNTHIGRAFAGLRKVVPER